MQLYASSSTWHKVPPIPPTVDTIIVSVLHSRARSSATGRKIVLALPMRGVSVEGELLMETMFASSQLKARYLARRLI